MSTLATYKTASGNIINLDKGRAPGAIAVTANGKFIGMFASLKAHDVHGTVISLVGIAAVVQVPTDSVALISSAIQAAEDIDAANKQDSLEKIAAYAKTSEGRVEAHLSRIHAADDDGRDRAERF
jgi:hypothetical protein